MVSVGDGQRQILKLNISDLYMPCSRLESLKTPIINTVLNTIDSIFLTSKENYLKQKTLSYFDFFDTFLDIL